MIGISVRVSEKYIIELEKSSEQTQCVKDCLVSAIVKVLIEKTIDQFSPVRPDSYFVRQMFCDILPELI